VTVVEVNRQHVLLVRYHQFRYVDGEGRVPAEIATERSTVEPDFGHIHACLELDQDASVADFRTEC